MGQEAEGGGGGGEEMAINCRCVPQIAECNFHHQIKSSTEIRI